MTVKVKSTKTGVNDPSLAPADTSVSGGPNNSIISEKEPKDTSSIQTGQWPNSTNSSKAIDESTQGGPLDPTSSKASSAAMSSKGPSPEAQSDSGKSTQGKDPTAVPAPTKQSVHVQLLKTDSFKFLLPDGSFAEVTVNAHRGCGNFSWMSTTDRDRRATIEFGGYICPAPMDTECDGKKEKCRNEIKEATIKAVAFDKALVAKCRVPAKSIVGDGVSTNPSALGSRL